MVKAEWGTKKLCQGCGASFYDMRHDPVICPKCGEQHVPAVVSKSSRSRSDSAAVAAPAEPEKVAETKSVEADNGAVNSEDDGNILAGEDDIESDDDKSDDDDVIEDPSEMGEDEDDMLEVIDNVVEKDES